MKETFFNPLSILLYCLVFYVGSYSLNSDHEWPSLSSGLISEKNANYKVANNFSKIVFYPMERLDRRFFPEDWQFFIVPYDVF
jgi:hypothetical protein